MRALRRGSGHVHRKRHEGTCDGGVCRREVELPVTVEITHRQAEDADAHVGVGGGPERAVAVAAQDRHERLTDVKACELADQEIGLAVAVELTRQQREGMRVQVKGVDFRDCSSRVVENTALSCVNRPPDERLVRRSGLWIGQATTSRIPPKGSAGWRIYLPRMSSTGVATLAAASARVAAARPRAVTRVGGPSMTWAIPAPAGRSTS